MHPELIKALIRIAGATPSSLADELGVSRMTVSQVIHGRGISQRVAQRISEIVNKPAGELWPGKYAGLGTNVRRQKRRLPAVAAQ